MASGAYQLATRWPEGGLGVASGAVRDPIPPVPPKTATNPVFIWEDSYDKGSYAEAPEFRRANPEVKAFNGVGFTNHPGGLRLGSWGFEFPGIETAVHVDGTLNDPHWK